MVTRGGVTGPLGGKPVLAFLPGTAGVDPPDVAQKPTLVLLIEPNRLTRELLAELLENHAADLRVIAVPGLTEDGTVPFDTPSVVLVCTGLQQSGDPAAQTLMRHLSERWPDVPRLMISERADDLQLALQALQGGWQGFFPTSLGADLLVAAIRLVCAQGLFIPPAMIQHCAQSFGSIPMHRVEDPIPADKPASSIAARLRQCVKRRRTKSDQ